MGRPRCDDSCLYEPDSINVGLLLFKPKTCSACGLKLPANTDYYSRNNARTSGLRSQCRRCRRTGGRASHEARKVAVTP